MAADLLTYDIPRLHDLLRYDPETGVFVWRNPVTKAKARPTAGSVTTSGYLAINIDGMPRQAHRIAWAMVHGRWPEAQIDHINMDKLDNGIANLRECSGSQNEGNKALSARNTSGIKGVSREGGRWRAEMTQTTAGKKRSVYLGSYETAEAAKAAYDAAATAYFGEFARP